MTCVISLLRSMPHQLVDGYLATTICVYLPERVLYPLLLCKNVCLELCVVHLAVLVAVILLEELLDVLVCLRQAKTSKSPLQELVGSQVEAPAPQHYLCHCTLLASKSGWLAQPTCLQQTC